MKVIHLHKAEEALRKSEGKYRILMEHAPEPVVVIKGENIEYANPVAIRNIRFSEEELYEMLFFDLISPSDLNVPKYQ